MYVSFCSPEVIRLSVVSHVKSKSICFNTKPWQAAEPGPEQ